ncbi:cysteine--1-D-myo-inosityl 2-amino-2-deoxy-alpha-D-glucopyranoside ligase [Saccharomonospora viridis]|jgi:L-cysteine:1D-myo-inositol 2-amino-2-deoxy-alpha-D-glucopyranoside ligase|uniref:L-cysteine:1D-myo-inositol 2-amino-2-deoxy-alpha-D-glucopyranoside ligase n=2 Tax=Saccharomonospora viridis TaxID=1852 RepID=MSHC_SACVD|nr:cysteine--1-D-myo-inosityl 2-amino-2-deoxy-alpha-D-glucopyranoside ligase [Saccharomonospora viridis]C7MWX8.1 RecName: Full=L-cysteine:1D-myo-inositol 2-amino-2-deoxy-alpha-D-glucopyranoside ligase; Short=L-Cys:GlcN-Ins ligase; AltName: Full=Mycothiol ligase; Short=MSH ligase [Saccharomonospora viridis DSM 43017]ACU97232.1 cysteinyl-tRNA synthetase [Saccharomonospora viridis DSM 43017]SFO78225.1 L-cysteine:1D-myo-inositol 2-amino-2-deoxy-alpha-D-glucopyranoside ligase [Saccharomonospora virid
MQTWSSVAVPRVPGTSRPLRLYDTATGQIRPTAPGRVAKMYVCGITPYDATHLGHAATYLAFDLVHRLWLDAGHEVHYVQNVTDIDDPLLERAERDSEDWVVLGLRETALFREDMEALRVLPPRDFVGAVESIPEVVEMIEKLLASGAAYRVDDPEYPDVYFDRSFTGRFGYESNYDDETMRAIFPERGGDPDRPGKRDPLDALLWRVERPGEPAWDSSLGRGRPGWHIECSAIALKHLGIGFDVQGGGSDLVFPHHEFSAAHAEAMTGEHPFARHYVHAGMIGLDGEKMSKSKGNLVFVSRLRADDVDPSAIRLALFAGHYRDDREWTDELLKQANSRLARWREAVSLPSGPDAEATVDRLRDHLADDLDTPKALAAVDAWVDEALRHRSGTVGSESAPALVRAAVDSLLGVVL